MTKFKKDTNSFVETSIEGLTTETLKVLRKVAKQFNTTVDKIMIMFLTDYTRNYDEYNSKPKKV